MSHAWNYIRVKVLLVVVLAATTTACGNPQKQTTKTINPPPPVPSTQPVDLTGRWVGTWTGAASFPGTGTFQLLATAPQTVSAVWFDFSCGSVAAGFTASVPANGSGNTFAAAYIASDTNITVWGTQTGNTIGGQFSLAEPSCGSLLVPLQGTFSATKQ